MTRSEPTLAHDVNNAMSVVLGNAELLVASTNDEVTAQLAREILAAGEQVCDLVARAETSTSDPRPGAGSHRPLPESETRVLVVDDEETLARTLSRLVTTTGRQARWTSDAETFMALHEQWRPTHVVLDLAMPGVDGVEVLARLAQCGSRASVIISSGVSQRVLDAAGRIAARSGLRVAGVMPKPFRLDTLDRLLQAGAETAFDDLLADERRDGRRASVADLRAALDGQDGAGTLSVAFQPKVCLRTGAVQGFEALARWDHPRLGQVPPLEFVAVAEATGLVHELTDRVLEQALGWAASLPTTVAISVNVSGLSMDDTDFVARERERVRRLGLPAASVVLELTETTAPNDPAAALQTLTSLRIAGFALSIDDFGTGYSSLSQLAHVPFSEVKIDRSFVASLTSSDEARAMVRSVIDLSHDLGLVTVAEGVEDVATLGALRAMGCDIVQGFLVGRPMAPATARAWLAEWREEDLVRMLAQQLSAVAG